MPRATNGKPKPQQSERAALRSRIVKALEGARPVSQLTQECPSFTRQLPGSKDPDSQPQPNQRVFDSFHQAAHSRILVPSVQ